MQVSDSHKLMRNVFSISSLLALKPCVTLGLLHGFVTARFSGVGPLGPRP